MGGEAARMRGLFRRADGRAQRPPGQMGVPPPHPTARERRLRRRVRSASGGQRGVCGVQEGVDGSGGGGGCAARIMIRSPTGRRWPEVPNEGRVVEAAKPPPDRRPTPLSARTTAAPPRAQALSQWERGAGVRGVPHCTRFLAMQEVMPVLGRVGERTTTLAGAAK